MIVPDVLLLRSEHNAEHDKDEASEAYGGSHLDASHAEDFGVEGFLGASAATHQYKAGNDYYHAYGKQDVVLFGEGQIVHFCLLCIAW
jgi:hypothetical protein